MAFGHILWPSGACNEFVGDLYHKAVILSRILVSLRRSKDVWVISPPYLSKLVAHTGGCCLYLAVVHQRDRVLPCSLVTSFLIPKASRTWSRTEDRTDCTHVKKNIRYALSVQLHMLRSTSTTKPSALHKFLITNPFVPEFTIVRWLLHTFQKYQNAQANSMRRSKPMSGGDGGEGGETIDPISCQPWTPKVSCRRGRTHEAHTLQPLTHRWRTNQFAKN